MREKKGPVFAYVLVGNFDILSNNGYIGKLCGSNFPSFKNFFFPTEIFIRGFVSSLEAPYDWVYTDIHKPLSLTSEKTKFSYENLIRENFLTFIDKFFRRKNEATGSGGL